MMCAMVKKAVVGTALGAGALFLVFGTSAPSYVKTAFHKVRHGVKGAVPPQFEIERAKQAIEDLKPMFDQNKETLARSEIEVENLEKEVTTIQANLDRAQKTIVSLRDSIKTGDIRLAGHVKDAEVRAKAELAHRLEHFRYTSDLLKQKTDVLQAKQKIIMGAHEQLQTLKSEKASLVAQLAKIEARLQMIETTQSKNDFNFDNSALSRAKKIVSELGESLDVMERKAEIEGRYGDLDGPSAFVDPHRDIVKEVDEQFGPSDSRPSAKSGDKSL
jgi:flagellar biosynthesis/type III secretory pathway chaperone